MKKDLAWSRWGAGSVLGGRFLARTYPGRGEQIGDRRIESENSVPWKWLFFLCSYYFFFGFGDCHTGSSFDPVPRSIFKPALPMVVSCRGSQVALSSLGWGLFRNSCFRPLCSSTNWRPLQNSRCKSVQSPAVVPFPNGATLSSAS